jgi:hypothetical protein
MTAETLLQRADTEVATCGKGGHRRWQVRLSFDDVDRDANGARPSLPSACRYGLAVRVIDSQLEPTDQAVDEWQSDHRLIEQAVWPEKLLLNINSMLIQLRSTRLWSA